MEPDPWPAAAESLDEHERDQVLARLAGTVVQPGQTERLARGERDVVFLLPDRLVLVRPEPFWTGSHDRGQVVRILLAAGHVQFDLTGGESVEFWIDTELSPAEPFVEQARNWLAPRRSSASGAVAGFGLAIVLALLFASGPVDLIPADDRLTARSTCGDFLRAGLGEQVELLRRLFGQAGRPDEAEKPMTLDASKRHCGEHGAATLDSLVTGR
ncbi:hypothetical protein SAMN05216188_105124 [Lentzea xinjiangensis]|uniref:Uncharacterized protein n=1 Tax=Lentzea xinjiangensis TaxID=402600 RepID=A0A1H9IYA6_9PSEU|nr:hypothetical protein [Lentzea xinjiangensis]SEQ79375.1 hypothetical protein SAMN05216188_105124 [Lentzea xinjiangensis]